MSTVDERPPGDADRQLADYFAWLDTELGPVAAPTDEAQTDPQIAPRSERSTRAWWWVAAAAAVVAVVAGLVVLVGRGADDETVPASPTGDLRDVSGWFELDLAGVEVIESFTTDPASVPAVHRDPYYVWADLDGDPLRSMSASFFDGDVPLDLDDDIDPPARIDSAPAGEAWVVDDPAEGANLLRVQWTRPDGIVVLTSGTNVDASTLATWTFAVGADPTVPPAPPDPALDLVLDATTVVSMPQYQENWMIDGLDASAWVATESPAVWLGLGYPTAERVTVAGRDGYRFGGRDADHAALVTFPLRNGYWGHLGTRGDRLDDLVDHIVIVDDRVPTPDEVTSSTTDDPGAAPAELASVWEDAVVAELATSAPDLTVDLTTASETYPIGAVSIVPFDTGGRLLVDLRVWATGEYEDEAAWFEATGASRFGTSFEDGAVFGGTDVGRKRVGIVTEQGVIELVVELPAVGRLVRPPLTDLDDPDVFDEAVAFVRRLAVRLPDVIADSGIDVDAGTVCADQACDDGQALATLQIASIDVDAFVLASSRAELLPDGPGLAPGSVPIGSPGVVRIWGHRTAYGAPFLDLDLLQPGDEVALTTAAGEAFVYVVDSVQVVEPGAPVPAAGDPTLVLSTPHPKYTARQELRMTARLCDGCGTGITEPVVLTSSP